MPFDDELSKDYEIANAFLLNQQFQKAIVFYQYVLKYAQPYDLLQVKTHQKMGDAFCQSGQYEKATTAYKAAIRLDPGAAYSHAQLGRSYLYKGASDRAIASLQQAVTFSPSCVLYSQDLARALLAANNTIEASKEYRRLGTVLRQSGKVEDAIATYQQALNFQPSSADLHQCIGECHHLQGNFSEAISYYQQVAQLSDTPLHVWFYKTWGEALLKSEPEPSLGAASQLSILS